MARLVRSTESEQQEIELLAVAGSVGVCVFVGAIRIEWNRLICSLEIVKKANMLISVSLFHRKGALPDDSFNSR